MMETTNYPRLGEQVIREILPNGLRHVVYDNGTEVFINYSDRPLMAGSVKVEAMGYTVQ